ncbi:EF-hand domain-containing protein D2 homolog isoform X2 [Bolinopsis microptera]|uniref:EF-hand domain-containing protein D2 homolog isoform X2 n=1 Tax=Bolinopsis microptera TaxID=2820187 RepID=UPI00307A93FF
MPLFSRKNKMLGGQKIVPMPRQRSNSLFQKLQRRQKIVEQREGAEIEPIMEVFNPLIEFKEMAKADIVKYEETFHVFDADDDGLLTLEEIKGAMRTLGTVMTHMEFKNIIKELDTDGDKMLDLREFICIYQKIRSGDGSDSLKKLVDEIEVATVGVGGAKNFFEDKAARTKETSYETELRIEREEAVKQKEAEEEKRKKMASKASVFGDVKMGKKPTLTEKRPSKLKIKKIKSKRDVLKSDDNGSMERQSSTVSVSSSSSAGGIERQISNISISSKS